MLSNTLEDICVKEIMQQDVLFISADQSTFEASVLMNNKSIGVLPVLDKTGSLVGIVTDRDIVVRCCACGKDIRKTKVKEIMTQNPFKTVPSHACKDVARLLGELGIRRLPIVENDKLVGIVSITDFAKAIDYKTINKIQQQPASIVNGIVRKLQTTSHYQLLV